MAEDNKDMRYFIQSLLTDYEVIAMENGLVAWEYLKNPNNKVDLVLSDVMMPQMDGFELSKRIKNANHLANVPLLILTARSSEQDQLHALTMGVDSYLTKPFSSNVLLAQLKNILHNYQKRKEWQQETAQTIENTPQKTIEKINITKADQKWIKTVENTVKMQLNKENFVLDDLAKMLNISERHLTRKLKKIVGLTPKKYIREIRLNVAYQYIQEGKYSTVSEVSYAVGFIKTQYFSELFRERFGQKPKELMLR